MRLNPLALLCAVTWLLLSPAGTAPARAQTGLTIEAEAGLDGYCKHETWLPVRVTVENNGANLEGSLYLKTSEGQREWQFSTSISIPSISRKETTLYAFPLGRADELEIGLVVDGDTLYLDTLSINCVDREDTLLGVWAQNPSVFNSQTSINPGTGRATLLVLDSRAIPDRPQGLSMLDALTISNVDTGELTADQRSAISGWVANGGRLVITGGPNWVRTAAGWDDLLPFKPNGSTTLDGLDSLSQAYQASAIPTGETIIATGEISPGAVVHASQGDDPLVVERGYGFGSIVYLTADPALEPLRTWEGTSALYQALLGARPDVPTWKYGFTQWFNANEALNTIAGLEIPPFSLICGGIIFYILLVGPINFLILRRLNRREAAWISIPAIVVVSTAFVLLISSSILGNRPIVNRMAIVEVWPEEEKALVFGLVGVFSPSRETFRLEMEEGFLAHPLPLQGFGQDSRTRQIVQTDEGFEIPELQIDIGDLEGVAVTGNIPAPQITADLSLNIPSGSAQMLTGYIRNNSEVLLQDAVLITAASSRQLGDIGPGAQVDIQSLQSGGASTPLNTPFIPGPVQNSDNTLFELFGLNYFYPTTGADTESYRRFLLMNAALGGGYGTRGGQSYLIAWTDEAPFKTALSGAPEIQADTTAYIFHLDPSVSYEQGGPGTFTLTPSFFSWRPFGSSSGDVSITPYSSYLDNGEFALEFLPRDGFDFTEVEGLVLHLESFGQSGAIPFEAALWDFLENTWSPLSNVMWGDTQIQAPDRYVGLNGEIRLRLRSAAAFGQQIERSDFTLIVRR